MFVLKLYGLEACTNNKAKQDKKEAEKKEKKRKRESGDSHGIDVYEQQVVEKPAKKKSKPNVDRGDVEIVAVKEKRRNDGRAGDEGDSGRRSKKVKTKS